MNIPDYSLEQAFEEAYVGWFLRDGLSLTRAQEAVRQAIQSHAEAGFRASLLASIVYYAKQYAKMYPERMRPAAGRRKTFTLAGYQPAVMQTVHVPGYRQNGPIQVAKKLLMEMEDAR